MCVDMGFQSFTKVSFLSTTLFSVRDADGQARINKIIPFFTFFILSSHLNWEARLDSVDAL